MLFCIEVKILCCIKSAKYEKEKKKSISQYGQMDQNFWNGWEVYCFILSLFFIWERSALLYLPKKNKKTNKQTKSIAFRICLQLVSILYIYIEREREREREREIFIWFNFGEIDLFGKSIFLSLAMNMTIFINKELFCFNMSIFFFFLFSLRKALSSLQINKYIVGIIIKFIMSQQLNF